MSAEIVAEKVGRFTNRRGLLGRAGAAALGSVLYLVGRPPSEAQALCYHYGCDTCSCETGCVGYLCSWCWWGTCSNHRRYLCCEGYNLSGSSCSNGNCGSQWYCSFLGGSKSC
ncbi:MAG: hypothetical protein ABI323_06835 [Solirubrobacteraceae bacterium]